jgi:hypothetical protein
MKETTFSPSESVIIAMVLVDEYHRFEKNYLAALEAGNQDGAEVRLEHMEFLANMIARTGYWAMIPVPGESIAR